MAKWIRNGRECSCCGFRLPSSAECYEWIERDYHGYQFKNYAVVPSECPAEVFDVINIVGGNEYKNGT